MNNYIEIRDFDKTRNFTVAMCIHTATITSILGAYTAMQTSLSEQHLYSRDKCK
jgi:hypothetical protein